MHPPRISLGGALFVLALLTLLPGASRAAGDGPLLKDALQAISGTGLRLIYSSETVPPDLRARHPPAGVTTEERLQSLLAPLGLEARPLPTGGYVIVAAVHRATVALSLEVLVDGETPAAPVPDAVVVIRHPAHRTTTDRLGQAAFTELVPADYDVEVRADGFRPLTRTVRLEATATTVPVEFRLVRKMDPDEEIVVETSRYEVGATLGLPVARESLAQSPVTSSDAVRSVQLLPGSAVAGYSARTHVRGSRDDETQFRYDGVTLNEPYHLGNLQGLFSAIDPAVVESVTSWTGVAPIQFNGRIGAVVDIEPRRVLRPMLDARTTERDVSLLIGTPFAGERGSVLVGGRLLNSLSPAGWLEQNVGSPYYADVVMRATWALGPRTQLVAGLLAINDHRDSFSAAETQRLDLSGRDRHAWFRLTHFLLPTVRSETVVSGEDSHAFMTGSVDRPAIEIGSLTKMQNRSGYAVREELAASLSPSWSARIGAERNAAASDAWLARSATYFAPFVPALQPVARVARDALMRRRGTSDSVYGGLRWQSDRTTADLGARRDSRYVQSAVPDAAWNVRANLRQQVSDSTTLRLGWGQVSQAPIYGATLAPDGTYRLRAGRRLTQTNASLEHVLGERWLVRAEAYDKREGSPVHTHENVFSQFSLLPELEVDRQLVRAQSAHMRGIELTVESDRTRALNGWLSYAWSRAADTIGGYSVPRSWDQPHAMQAGAIWRHGPWHLSGVFAWHSGWPYTPLLASATSWRDSNAVTFALAPRNSARLENFTSLDLRLSWERWIAGGVLEASLEVHDATNSRTQCCREYAVTTEPDGTSRLVESQHNWLRFTPIIGVRWRR
jgi:carboxypeptidase family protein